MGTLKLNTTSGGSLSIQAADGASDNTLTLPAVTGGNIVTTADSGTITQGMIGSGVATTGPAFSAYIGSGQAISPSTLTKIQFNTERFDTNSAYDSTTNYRFTPLVAGYYQVNIGILSGNSIDTVLILYKSGSEYGSSEGYAPSFSARPRYATLVYMNGSTDYLEAYTYIGGSNTLTAGIISSEFSAVLVRAA